VRRLFLHIGTHKTGSTAIQHALGANREALARSGYALIPRPAASRELMRATSYDSQLVASMGKQLSASVKLHAGRRTENLLLSWEGFSGDPQLGYANSHIIARVLREITVPFHVTIVSYLRQQDEFVESLYTQHIQRGHSLEFSAYLQRFDASAFDWSRLLASFAKCFGQENVSPRRYHKVLLPESSSLLDDFSRVLELPFNLSLPGRQMRNPSMSRQALELARLANPHLSEEEKKCLRHILQQSNAKQLHEAFCFFSPSERSRFLSQYKQSNAEVCGTYFDEPSGELFPKDVSRLEHSGAIEDVIGNPGEVLANAIRYLSAGGTVCPKTPRIPAFARAASRALSRFPELHRTAHAIIRTIRSIVKS